MTKEFEDRGNTYTIRENVSNIGEVRVADEVVAIIAGLVIDHFHQPWLQLIGMIVGTIICYVLGTAWFCFEAKSTVSGALSICVLPFIPGDLIKMIIAMLIGPAIKKRLR